jgi:hypothetical protein
LKDENNARFFLEIGQKVILPDDDVKSKPWTVEAISGDDFLEKSTLTLIRGRSSKNVLATADIKRIDYAKEAGSGKMVPIPTSIGLTLPGDLNI